MDNVQVQLSKLMVSNSPGGNIQLLSDIARQSENAVQQIASRRRAGNRRSACQGASVHVPRGGLSFHDDNFPEHVA
jgi:hypothetical protein